MIKLIDLLLEAPIIEIGDGSSKAFSWKYHKEHPAADSEDFGYTFKTDQGDYYVSFTLSGNNEWDLAFGPLGGSSANYGVVTGVGAFRVMATIVEIVNDFLKYTYKMHINDKELYGETEPKKYHSTQQKRKEDQKKRIAEDQTYTKHTYKSNYLKQG